jgi:DoxX-like family
MKQSKTPRIVGWTLSILIGLFLIGASGLPKFAPPPEAKPSFEKLGLNDEPMFKIGVIEVFFTLLFLIPWTGFIGAILLTAYLGGAVFCHMRVGDPWWFPTALGVLVWVALGLRNPAIFALASSRSLRPAT